MILYIIYLENNSCERWVINENGMKSGFSCVGTPRIYYIKFGLVVLIFLNGTGLDRYL